MSKPRKNDRDSTMTLIVQGHEVEMQFTEKPNPQVAIQVKQALLGAYLPTKKECLEV